MARILLDPPLQLHAPPAHLSYSQVTKLVARYKYSCPRQWGYDKLASLPFQPSPVLLAGSAFDEGINALLQARMQALSEAQARVWAWQTVQDKWKERLPELREPLPAEKQEAYLKAVRLGMTAFAATHPELVPAAVQQRHDYHVHVGPAPNDFRTVTGYSDRIEEDGTLIDMKWSGSKRWKEKEAKEGKSGEIEWDEGWTREKRDQLAMYWMAREIEQARGDRDPVAPVIPRGRLEVLYMRLNQKEAQLRSIEFEFTAEDRQRVVEAILEADRVIRENRLPARPGDACGFCSFRARCQSDEMRRGQAFADLVKVV